MTAIDIAFQPGISKTLRNFGLLDAVTLVEALSLDAAEEWSGPISFLYIDGHHGRAHAYADILCWDPFVLPQRLTSGRVRNPSIVSLPSGSSSKSASTRETRMDSGPRSCRTIR